MILLYDAPEMTPCSSCGVDSDLEVSCVGRMADNDLRLRLCYHCAGILSQLLAEEGEQG